MDTYTLKLLTPRSLADKQQGRILFDLLIASFPRHIPAMFGKSEPPRERFESTMMDHVLNSWGALNFLATREGPSLRLHVHFWPTPSRNPQHSSISVIRFESDRTEDADSICQFLYSACEVFEPDLAVAHILTQAEMGEHIDALAQQPNVTPEIASRSAENMKGRMQREGYASVLWGAVMSNLNTSQLRKCLPNMHWIIVFGPPYIEMFGEDKILSTPSHEVRRLPPAAISMRLTAAIADNASSWQEFKTARRRAKDHLDSNAFFDASLPKDHIYNAPTFGAPQTPRWEGRQPMVVTAGGTPAKRAIMEAIARRKKP